MPQQRTRCNVCSSRRRTNILVRGKFSICRLCVSAIVAEQIRPNVQVDARERAKTDDDIYREILSRNLSFDFIHAH
jgi:hypothetical protein